MAGIWDTWLNQQTGEQVSSFCIITTTANSLMQKIGHHRMPVILSENEERKWINSNTDLSRITAILNHYDTKLMNAYPIDPKIKNPIENDKQLIQPIGARVLAEDKNMAFQIPRGAGYHQARNAYQRGDNTTMAERLELARANETLAMDDQTPVNSFPIN